MYPEFLNSQIVCQVEGFCTKVKYDDQKNKDHAWSQNGLKRTIWEKKSKIHILTFQNILHLFLLYKKNTIADSGLTHPPVCGNVRN